MKIKNYFLLCLVAMMAVTACKKSGTPPPPIKIDTDVYVMGQIKVGTNDVVAYWKNGVLTKLSDTTKNCEPIGKIFVNGSDVYAAGFYDSTRRVPLYWKNGKETRLSMPDSVHLAEIHNITVNNNSVYVIGMIFGPHKASNVYWKDTDMPVQPQQLQDFDVNAVAVNGTEVDIAGDTYIAAISGTTSAYLKGDVIQPSTDNLRGKALSIALDGSDIYTAGYTIDTKLCKATYWKNGVPTYITNGSSNENIYAMALKDQAVYTAGHITANGKVVATCWKNTTPYANLALEANTTSSDATGIAVVGDGNDVYVSGYIYNGTSSKAVSWKNGVKTTLPRGINAIGIAVVTHLHNN